MNPAAVHDYVRTNLIFTVFVAKVSALLFHGRSLSLVHPL